MLELGAMSEREFFDKNNPLLRISFDKDDAGVVTGLVVHRGASDFRAQRIDDVGR
jgi:hypothetical protein